MYKIVLVFFFCCFFCVVAVTAQVKPLVDSPAKAAPAVKAKAKKVNIFNLPDTLKQYPPRVATIRSAILPGWGQITNRKYWKLPLVYGGIGVTAGIFIYNIKTFREAKAAYINAIDRNPGNDFEIPEPYFSVRDQPERIRSFRNQIRQNVDYSALFFLIFWGLNVVDATVDAHLRYFDVGNNLSLQLKPGYSPLAQTNGLSVVLHIGK
jgi:Family of unknown function (DUF5683)